MKQEYAIPILSDLVKIDKHTDNIKSYMCNITNKMKLISDEMTACGKLYLDVLVLIKKDAEQ